MKNSRFYQSRIQTKIAERDIRASIAEVKAHIKGKTDLPLAKDIEF